MSVLGWVWVTAAVPTRHANAVAATAGELQRAKDVEKCGNLPPAKQPRHRGTDELEDPRPRPVHTRSCLNNVLNVLRPCMLSRVVMSLSPVLVVSVHLLLRLRLRTD